VYHTHHNHSVFPYTCNYSAWCGHYNLSSCNNHIQHYHKIGQVQVNSRSERLCGALSRVIFQTTNFDLEVANASQNRFLFVLERFMNIKLKRIQKIMQRKSTETVSPPRQNRKRKKSPARNIMIILVLLIALLFVYMQFTDKNKNTYTEAIIRMPDDLIYDVEIDSYICYFSNIKIVTTDGRVCYTSMDNVILIGKK
jgi:hypothetical protein